MLTGPSHLRRRGDELRRLRPALRQARLFLSYRVAGRDRRLTIGSWPDWSVTAAREEAKRLKREIDAGRDPLSKRIELRNAPSMCDLIDRYLKEHAVTGPDNTPLLYDDPLRAGLDQVGEILRPKLRAIGHETFPERVA